MTTQSRERTYERTKLDRSGQDRTGHYRRHRRRRGKGQVGRVLVVSIPEAAERFSLPLCDDVADCPRMSIRISGRHYDLWPTARNARLSQFEIVSHSAK
jgi:hypothetical protein